MRLVTDSVVYMQNRKDGIEHEITEAGIFPHVWFDDDGGHDVDIIEAMCRERRVRVKQKDIPQELAREAVRLLKDIWREMPAANSFRSRVTALLSKLEES